MEDYSIGTALASEFDVTNQLRYSPNGDAFVRSSNSTVTKPLSAGLSPGADHVVIVSFDKDKKRSTLGTKKDIIAGLFQDWNIPKAAISHLFVADEPHGLSSVSVGSTRCCWYHAPVAHLTNADFEYGALHVWQVLDVDTSHVRLLVLCPSFMTARMRTILPSLFKNSLGLGDHQWPQMHLALIRAAIETWRTTRWFIMSMGGMSLREMTVATDSSLDARPINSCHSSLAELSVTTDYIVRLRRTMDTLCQYFERELPGLHGLTIHPAISYMRNFNNDIDFMMDSYSHLEKMLLLTRHRLSGSIKIKNASYMRANTIALRRIAEQNQRDAQEVTRQAELTQRSSQSMAKIAYMTMIYLPANFIATCFGMPFLDLDDGKRFHNLSQIWIYFVATLVTTVLTFLGSIFWDKLLLRVGKQSDVSMSNDVDDKPDVQILEPAPYAEPDPEELIQQVIATLAGKNEERDDDDNSEGEG